MDLLSTCIKDRIRGNYIKGETELPVAGLNIYYWVSQNLKRIEGENVSFSGWPKNWVFQVNPIVSLHPSVA